jgi:ABC-type branched-subunit amino acid transport system substrate-binding protein
VNRPFRFTRRQLIAAGAVLPWAAAGGPAWAQSGGAARPVKALQWLDRSADQQELSRDHATGVQLAVALHNRQNPARPVQLSTLELDGAADLPRALAALRENADVSALVGTCGERLALAGIEGLRKAGVAIAQVGPWLGDTRHDGDDAVLPLFASREQQLRHALKSVEAMGLTQLGVVYASRADRATLAAGTQAAAQKLGLQLQPFGGAGEDVAALADSLPATSPPLLLFLGGAVELARFTAALSRRKLQRYVVSLSDVDVAALVQLGATRTVPVILTQVVPNPSHSALGVVQAYRQGLKLLYDEAPSPISLAGYLTGRYFVQALSRLEGPATRATVLQHFMRRPPLELDGFSLGFAQGPRGSSFVTQTMLTADGRLVG